ncbi:MAG: 4a-hydroxytetrahydrobiopterin dehydratase [Hydrogenobacter thermophilus]|uniref:4a-hydroxytetrahydrobiopterin dehydratase n=1 Tax=Hydrogenobacter thermophilus (strain DSM 6534 / IAM 12695 / TK-6) TaxID=608538 RepID=D3DJ88_HYDTT|nr:4a-hydroxytetrahydrobiopterin dehydratase [Hydrogenobacter thermophilus]GBC88383.1 Putative pterin-4-alpha-carbinolamine dehydratase [bacterium HR13]ADO45813.1 transcriptional coactivator/pterin dehydratase [Hydrogenobacter thermophilus TK-6]MCS7284690.1 4a-hydroxytetrahydrobiopterin dehydratase [Hydrogenobacter thermophilus]QWK18965.1 MAG: 4a-hydroxytetrahydrobiopterin dehydratase [Hydrogenobacter thermophilus]BAI69890.1 pterin-4-alpha-carbinolamine dehydratase [Hydrogenobacter thermophilu
MSEERELNTFSPSEVIDIISRELPNWHYQEGFIIREFFTKNWKETVFLANAIAYLAEAYWHHPDLELSFKRLKVKLQTHEVGGITQKDFTLAKEIERIASIKPI